MNMIPTQVQRDEWQRLADAVQSEEYSHIAFYAAARLAIPALLDAVRELQNRCDQLTDDNRLFQTELASAMDQIHSG